MPSALREIASKVFFLWPNCLAGEAAFFGQRTKTLIRGFPCFNGLGCFLPCPGHTQFLLKGRWRGRRTGSPGRRAPVQRPALNEPRTANKAGLFRTLAVRPETHRLTIQAEAYLATMPKKRKNSAKQAEAFANNMKNRHVVKAAPVVAEVEQQPTKKKGPNWEALTARKSTSLVLVQVIAEQQPSANDAHPSIRPKLCLFRAVNLKLAKRAGRTSRSRAASSSSSQPDCKPLPRN